MVGSENKRRSVFSWADEVEREEEARTQEHEKQKPNPFGSARPREVVLREKGIDWRKLDQHLQQSSRTRNEPLKEKKLKENIPTEAAQLAVNRQQQFYPSRNGLNKMNGSKMGSNRREILHPQVLLTSQNYIPEIFVPPLRYPPKNVASLLKEPCSSYNPYMSNSGQQNFQYISYTEPEREKTFREPRLQRNHIRQYNNNLDGHIFNIERESQHTVFADYSRGNVNEELSGLSMEAQNGGRNLGKLAAYEEGGIADSNCKRTKFSEQNLVGSRLVNERRDCKNIHNDYGRRDGRRRFCENSEREKTGHQGNYNRGMQRYGSEEIRWEKMEYGKEEQNIAGKFAVSSREEEDAGGDGGRAKDRNNVKMKSADFGGKYRKRGNLNLAIEDDEIRGMIKLCLAFFLFECKIVMTLCLIIVSNSFG